MAVKIKLMRMGKMRAPYYRIVVADARTKRDGRSIETIGKYHPKENPSVIQVDGERAAYWLGVGAQPTEAVQKLLSKTGDWQKFKGEAAPAPLLMAEPRVDKKVAFEAAALASVADAGAATTPRKKAAPKKADEAKAEEPKADEAPAAEEPKADEAPAEEKPAAEAKAEEPTADEAPAAEAAADETAAE